MPKAKKQPDLTGINAALEVTVKASDEMVTEGALSRETVESTYKAFIDAMLDNSNKKLPGLQFGLRGVHENGKETLQYFVGMDWENTKYRFDSSTNNDIAPLIKKLRDSDDKKGIEDFERNVMPITAIHFAKGIKRTLKKYLRLRGSLRHRILFVFFPNRY